MELKYLVAIAVFFLLNNNLQGMNILQTAGAYAKTPAAIAGAVGIVYATPIATKLTLAGLHKLFTKTNMAIQTQCEKMEMGDAAAFIQNYQNVIDGMNNDYFTVGASALATYLALLGYIIAVCPR